MQTISDTKCFIELLYFVSLSYHKHAVDASRKSNTLQYGLQLLKSFLFVLEQSCHSILFLLLPMFDIYRTIVYIVVILYNYHEADYFKRNIILWIA